MFREIRRKAQALPKEEIEKILRENADGVLALTDADGWPYAVPINYFYEDGCLFMHCGKEGHRMDCLAHDTRASFCVVGANAINQPHLATDYKSVICFGRCVPVEDEAERKALVAELCRRLAPETSDEAVEKEYALFAKHLVILKMKIEHVTGKEGKYLAIARKKAAKQ